MVPQSTQILSEMQKTLTLFRSHLGGGPPRYEPIVEAQLVG